MCLCHWVDLLFWKKCVLLAFTHLTLKQVDIPINVLISFQYVHQIHLSIGVIGSLVQNEYWVECYVGTCFCHLKNLIKFCIDA